MVVWGRCGSVDGGEVSRWGEMSITRAERTWLFGKRQRRPIAKRVGVRRVGRIFGVERAAGQACVTMCIPPQPPLSLLIVGIMLCRFGGCGGDGEGS